MSTTLTSSFMTRLPYRHLHTLHHTISQYLPILGYHTKSYLNTGFYNKNFSSSFSPLRGISTQSFPNPTTCASTKRYEHSISRSLPRTFLSQLSSKLPQLNINTNKYDLDAHGKGESFHPVAPPVAILEPHTAHDISTILKVCSAENIPVIAYGTGTSVEGHVCAIDDRPTVSIDMSHFKSIHYGKSHDTTDDSNSSGMLDDFHVTVGAGVTRLELNEALRHTGAQFMVDPGADASIGGMAACGASGTTAVKYGTMRENILSIECVLADGTIANCGSNTLKSSAGYDLTSLMIGSEGTLGIITKVTVKVHPIPEHIVAAVCTFDSLHSAAEAVSVMRMCGIPLERCELLDESSIEAFNEYNVSNTGGTTTNMKSQPTLFLEFTGPTMTAVDEIVDMSKSVCVEDYGGSDFVFTANEEERQKLWKARHQLYYASLALRPGAKDAILTDACVPLSHFADIITHTAQDVKDLNVIGPCFGHAGDGNFHCILPVVDGDSEEYIDKLHKVNDNLIQRTIEVGGTCTGEHGVGYGKIKYLKRQFGSGGVKIMATIKKSLDPLNIMNPGKVIDL